MKVLDIINLSAKLLNEIDLKKCVEFCIENNISLTQLCLLTDESEPQKPTFFTEQVKRELKLLLDCVNITQTVIAVEKNNLFCSEKITVTNGKFDIDNLSHKLFKIKEITNGYQKQKYVLCCEKIILNDGTYEIKYCYYPTEVNFEDEVECHNGKLSLLCMCYGVCEQYALIKNLYQEEQVWHEKFDTSLNSCFKKLGGILVKRRRWI